MQTLYFETKDYEEDYTAVERRVYEEGLRLGNELAVDLDTLQTCRWVRRMPSFDLDTSRSPEANREETDRWLEDAGTKHPLAVGLRSPRVNDGLPTCRSCRAVYAELERRDGRYRDLRAVREKAQMSLFFLDQYPRLFTALLKTHPHVALDGLLDSGSNLQRRGTGRRRFESGGLFAALPEKTIIDWCEKKMSSRYVLMASVIDAICEADNGDCSWQPLALSLLAKAPNKPKSLAAYFRQFRPMTWSGSRASLMERRLRFFGELLSNPTLHKHYGFIQSERDNFTLDIERDRLLDRKLSAQSAATFE